MSCRQVYRRKTFSNEARSSDTKTTLAAILRRSVTPARAECELETYNETKPQLAANGCDVKQGLKLIRGENDLHRLERF